jgi:glycosyltransferase involved in cell wall biosynthesis
VIRHRYPDVRVTLVGRGPPNILKSLERPDVQVVGEVPDIRPYLQRAAVVIVPLRMGGGTRLKVVEGLAMAKGIVSTTIGAEGVNARHGEHLLIADTVHAFASEVVGLFDDPRRAVALGRAARALAEREYSWDLAGQRLEDLYARVLGDMRGTGRQPTQRRGEA